MIKKIIFALILIWLGWHLAHPIYLIQADLGRHIKNGEMLFKGVWEVLFSNYYSYTIPHYPVINHHWLFGICSYLVWLCTGFAGLSMVYVALVLIVFVLFVSRAQSISFPLLCAFSLISFPLISSRPEIRPEGFSMLFCGLFWLLADLYNQGRLKANGFKIAVFFLQILWVNSHSYFPLGPVMMFALWLQAKCNRQEQAKTFLESYFILLFACLINPSGLSGALYPLQGRAGLGYSIIEEQSLDLMMKGHPSDLVYPYFIGSFVFTLLGLGLLIKRQGLKKHLFMLIMFGVMSYAAFNAVRFISPYAFFWVPITVYCWGHLINAWPVNLRKMAAVVLVIFGVVTAAFVNFSLTTPPGFGLVKGNSQAGEFFKAERLKGPIFNNYDIGGYLIFYLSPHERLFVDNRVEAFPADFFKKIYVPMQIHDEVWKILDHQIDFNVIFFARVDQTPWSYDFITRRFEDPSWAVVFIDDNAVILLKRNQQNADVIKNHEILVTKRPKSS